MSKRKVNVKIFKQWSEKRKYPASELSFKAEVSHTVAAEIISGKRVPSSPYLRNKIAEVLGFEVDIVFPGESEEAA